MSRAPDLDLHPYYRDPDKARAILDACIADNVRNRISLVRVVHGKGSGNFRQLIHSHLERHPDVEGFVLCDPLHGGDGATWVHLKIRSAIDVGDVELSNRPVTGISLRWLIYLAAFGLLFFLKADWMIFTITLIVVLAIELWIKSQKDEDDYKK